jgi:hypothetical protein
MTGDAIGALRADREAVLELGAGRSFFRAARSCSGERLLQRNFPALCPAPTAGA